ncbi:MFS transporter [Streptomyces sp. BF23-18]|uniref:MFS transporter n=1 Tax=Streptomyces sp. BF23-18 TaxID=3240282 RepID=UPI0034E51CBD
MSPSPAQAPTRSAERVATTWPRRLLATLLPPTPQVRPLALSTALHTVGTGIIVTLSILYFTRIVGLSTAQVGVGLTAAGGIGLCAGIPLGRLADRFGPRGVLIIMLCCQASAIMLHIWVTTLGGFLAVTALLAFANEGATAVRSAMIARSFASSERITARAYLRAITNLGFAVGTSLASIPLTSTDPAPYRVLIAVSAVCFLAAAGAMLRTPAVAVLPTARAVSPWRALRDAPFLAVTACNAVLQLHYAVLEIGIPLWVAEHTDAPPSTISVLFVLNTAFVLVFQVPVGRRWGSLRHAGRATAVAGVLVALACLLLGLAGDLVGVSTLVVLITAGAVHATGEILHTTGSWAAGFDLAPDDAQGQYQGLYSTGMAMAQMLGPAFVTTVILANGDMGWVTAAGTFALAGLCMSVVIQLASTRKL